MSVEDWLKVVVLGFVLGAVGQGARTIVGYKKLSDFADDTTGLSALVDGMRLLISFGIGGVAGALAAIVLQPDNGNLSVQQVLGIAASGYTGSDFIEGMITRITGQGVRSADAASTTAKTLTADDAVG
jgi:putative chitinase